MQNYFQSPWKIKDTFICLLISGIIFGAGILMIHLLDLTNYFKESPDKTLYTSIFFIFQWLILILPILFVGPGYKKLTWNSFGFKKYPILKTIFTVIKGYFLYLLISIGIITFILQTNIEIPGYQVDWSIFNFFNDNIYSIAIAGILIVIIGPILEEIFFRGFILRTISDKTGLWWGSIISAGFFAILHFPWANIIPIFILGLIINSMVIKSKSLWPAIIFHIFNNAIAFTLQLLLFKEIISIENLV
jgi:uncharacterized protein